MNENVDFIARCIAGSAQETARKAITDLGGMQILKITKEEFDSIDHDPNTLYFVLDGNKIIQYIGDSKLSSGITTSGFMFILSNKNNNGYVGNFKEIEV